MSGLKKTFIVIGFAFVLFMAFGFYKSNTPAGKEKGFERDKIQLCWSDHKKASLDDATKRFVASTCEKLESDYRSKYGTNP